MKPTNTLKTIWDKVTLDTARLKRGMEEASIGGAPVWPMAMAGVIAGQLYHDGFGGVGTLALTALATATAYAVGLLAIKSRVEIYQFDKKYTKDAVAYYEANKNKAPSPPG